MTMAVVLTVCFTISAQGTDSSLSGVVTDPSHAAISGARVTANNKSTNFEQEVTTDTNGSYSFLNLPIGTYTVVVEQAGFRKPPWR